MIDRYSRPHLRAIWEPTRKYQTWLQVELLACEALSKKGLVPASAIRQIRSKARINPVRIDELERVTKHDVIAFIESISEQVGPAARYLHMGLTSSDILDTSLAVLMVEAALSRAIGRVELAKMPLAADGRFVARRTQGVGQRPFRQGESPFGMGPDDRVHTGMHGITAAHERCPSRRTDRLHVERLQDRAAMRQLVEVGRHDLLAAHEPGILIALIIGEDDDDVGPCVGGPERGQWR